MLYSNKNVQVRKTHFIDKSFPKEDEIRDLFKKASNNEIGKKTLQYFAEEELQSALPYFLNCNAITIEGKGFTARRPSPCGFWHRAEDPSAGRSISRLCAALFGSKRKICAGKAQPAAEQTFPLCERKTPTR